MSSDKYQSGEAYRDDRAQSSTSSFLSDPAKVAADILKDYAGARSEASLQEIIGLVQSLRNEGTPADDRKGNTEVLIGILTGLPSGSATRVKLTNKLIDTLWDNLQHPPLSYVGGDVKYDTVNAEQNGAKKPNEYDIIEFDEPTTGVRLREQVPQPPNGMHHFRMPDGSFNNVLQPNLGKAGSPYAKSVRSVKRLHAVRPDPGLLFDLLMSREEDTFKENPAGISSMLFYHASIIIHDVFRTSRTDMNKSDTSSYLDLAPLYGSSLRDQLKVRTMQGGKLKPDTFHEKRLLGQPAGVNVMLVLYSRFHNYVVDVLLKINENGRFTLSCPADASPEDKAKALAKQDHDLFNTGRLITCGLYVNISLHDYLRAITNTHHSQSDWTLDPRVEIDKHFDGEGVPRGVGNQVSVEFNLLYRFHSCISKKDEWWINNFFMKLFPGRKPEDLANVSLQELGRALVQFEQSVPEDPSKRVFDDLQRQADGRFKDEDLARVLKEAMDDPAGSFGARMVPKALKIVEVLGINQARKWQVASLNEFREFFGLKRYQKFSEINPDPDIAGTLEKLYNDPDMVELYPGLMIEETKKPRNPGSGICPTYTVGRAVLADAITLVRSDRFNTIDFTVSTLTAWGINEIKQDTKTLGGSMLYRLIQRGLPGWFPFNSVAVMQPMYTKKANEAIAREHGILDQYTLDDPKPPPKLVKLVTKEAIQKVLNDKQYLLTGLKPLNSLFPGKKDYSWFMLAGDEPRQYDHRAKMTKAMGKIPNLHKAVHDFIDRVGSQLIQKESFKLKEGLHQLDILRDVAIPLNIQLMADLFYFDLRTDENPDGKLGCAELYNHLLNVRVWGTNNTDPAESWNRRRRAQEGCKIIADSTRGLVNEVVASKGLGLGLVSALSNVFSRKAYLKKDSLRSCGLKLVEELLGQGSSAENVTDQLWLMAFGGVGVLVTTFYEVMEFFLRPENATIWSQVQTLAQQNNETELHKYVKEAQRLTSPVKTVRAATKAEQLEGQSIQPGNVVVLMLGESGRTPVSGFEDADKFLPGRADVVVDAFSYGPHECFGQHLALAFVTGLVKLVADLKKLRPAPGQMGEVKTIQVGFEKVFLNDSWSHLAHNASTWKVHFDGHGKGNFEGDREPTKRLDMQEYYYQIRKRKAELLK